MRGLMIDCSRLMERHGYYHELVDELAAWGYDTLVLHLCDDHGLTAVLPGFEDLAAPHALGADELAALIARGRERNVRIIPEIECFGHTRWLAGHPRWGACFAGDRSDRELAFNAVDPSSPLSAEVMERLIEATCRVFPDEVVHIGCDEVDLGDFCARRGLGDPDEVWAGWVNRLIAMVVARGRRAMLWADHLEREPRIAALIDKRAIAVSWHYGPTDDADDAPMRRLQAAGFAEVVSAPAVQCWRTRAHVSRGNLENVERMERHARAVGATGTLDTIWCPFRHLQGALWHGIASAALIHREGRMPDDDGTAVCALLFGTGDAAARRLCRELPDVVFSNNASWHLWRGTTPEPDVRAEAEASVRVGSALLAATAGATVERHPERLAAMLLSVRVSVHLCRLLLEPAWRSTSTFAAEHAALITALEADWDATRFPDDPARSEARWADNWGSHYLLPLMRRLAVGRAAAAG